MYKPSRKEKKILIGVGVGIALLLVVPWAYRCVTKEVCTSPIFERIVRDNVDIKLPDGKIIKAEVVKTSFAREQGLSGRKGLGENKGMLFEFPLPGRFGFWMKDMLFSIDIIWINKDGVVVNIVEYAKPEDYPATYVNQAPASYVLEIEAGKAGEYGIHLGTKLDIQK